MSSLTKPRMITASRMDNGRVVFDILGLDNDTQAKDILDDLEDKYGTAFKLILKRPDAPLYVYDPEDYIFDLIDEELEKGNLPLLHLHQIPNLSRPRSR